ncbi:hypothetical protein MRS44_015813 [Fusarium solani]|uniref:uncharacterized protein n=1 Tax=Fusarium solani TaxID=169388 RepID=UPI0032C42F58|nr:hypothetical protein MRS44_015813 [Fusarium solani]
MADPLSMAASIAGLISLADTLFRHTYKFGRTATGAKKEIQALATEINSFSGILRNLEALADELEAEGQAFEPAFQVDHLIECRKIFDKIERQVTKALDSFNNRSRWEGISRQLKWPFSASDTRDLLQQLSRCKDSITLATSADTMRNLQLCLMKQREQGETLSKMAASLEKIEVRTAIIMDPRKQLVLDFFMPPKLNPQANLDQSLKLRQPATGEWFTQSFAFMEWLQSPGSKLWLNGTAGGGKTVLAGAMIQEAIVRSGAESDVAVAFFFCDYKQEATLKSVNIIGALASQLAIQRDDSFDLLQEHYQELHPARGLNKPADVDELARVTASMCNLFSQVIIVVDGLDECGDAVFQALETLCDLADLASTNSMALLSRNEVEIRQALEGGFKEFIIEAREEDLKIYVRAEMERRIRTKQLDIQNKTIKDEIQTELVSRANGMFRWVVCQLDYLGQLLTDADRRLALYELPPTLSETYLRLLQRINKRPPRVRKLVQKCLSFIAFSPSMSVEALCLAVSVPETIGARMDETNTVSEKEIALCCSSLIRKSAQDECFEFAHFSVKEFLQDEMLLQIPGLDAYKLVESEARVLISLQYLRFLQVGNIDDDYVESFLSWDDETEIPGFSSFFRTASTGWLDLTWGGLDDPSLLDAAKSLFHQSTTLNFRTPLLLAEVSFLGFIEDLSGEYPDRGSLYFENILPSSSRRNNTIDCLMSSGASFNDLEGPVGDHSVLLSVATIGCHFQDFDPFITLLDHGHIPTDDDITAFGDCLKTCPKSEDCSDLEEAILRLLNYLMKSSSYDLDWGFDLGNKVWLAAVTLGFDFTNDTTLTDSRISLSVAALVDKALLAIENDDTAMVQLCLKDGRVGIDQPLQQGSIDGILLHHAVAADALGCTRLLLELGSDPECRTNAGTSTLHCCNLKGDGSALKLLAEHQVPLLAQGSDSGTLWHACASSYSCEVSFVEALFSIDSECNQKALLMRTEAGLTPPMLALMALEDAPQDYVERLESKALLFLHYCQKTPDFWDQHGSLFTLASRAGSKKVFQLLLQLDPGSHMMKPGDSTPFHSLGVNPTKEWLEFLTATYPEALQLRFEDRLPLEIYIEKALQSSEAPQSDVGATPWKVVCDLKEEVEFWDNSEYLLGEGSSDLVEAWVDLFGLKAMEGYEIETGRCGVFPLLDHYWTGLGTWLVPVTTLEQAIQSSGLWDPTQDVVLGYLKEAIKDKNTAVVELLVKYNADVHQRESGISSLEFACQSRRACNLCSEPEGITILQCLLDHSRPEGVREFSTDKSALSILHGLAMRSPPERIEWLLRQLVEKGADPNAMNPNAPMESRMPPLIWHLDRRSIRCAEVLLELGADPRLARSDFRAVDAVFTACSRGYVDFLDKLDKYSKEKSIDMDWMRKVYVFPRPGLTFRDATLFHCACAKKDFDMVKFLVERRLVDNVDSVCEGGFTALHLAAMCNQAAIIDFLVSHEASVNLQCDQGQIALHLAAAHGNIEATSMLLKLGALNVVDMNGETAHTLASAEGHGDIMKILHEQLEPRSESETTESPLKKSALLARRLGVVIERNNKYECQRLLADGCPIDEPIPRRTPTYPLLYALKWKRVAIVELLLANGANVRVNDGDTCPLGQSRSVVEEVGRYPAYLSLLPTILDRYHEDGGCWLHHHDVPVHHAAWNGHLKGLRIMLDFLAKHAAAISHIRPEDVVSSVVNRKLGLGQLHPKFRGMTTLHIAVWCGNLACTQLLLENGADPDQLTTEGKCPLDFTTDPKMTALLLQHGASPAIVLTDSFSNLLKDWGGATTIGLDCLAAQETLPAIAIQGHGYAFNYFLWTWPQLPSYLLNSEVSLEALQPFPWHWLGRHFAIGFLDTTFKQFRRRFGDSALKRWLNLQPDRGWSPLCRAASQGSIKIMENCLDMGADLDFEGCPLGSALMIASACGRLEAVRLLVRSGATVTYNGKIGPINVFSVARSRKVKSWLLVGRFNDRLRLHAADEASTRHSNTQVSCWSGIVQARFKLVGWTARHGEESAFDYARRLCQIKRTGFTDGIVPADGFIYPQKSTHFNFSTSSEGGTAALGEQRFHLDAEATSSESVCSGPETSQTSASAQKYEASCREVLIARGAYHNTGAQGFMVNIGIDST